LNFGSIHNFLDVLHSWGIEQISGFFLNSAQSPGDRANHDRIIEDAKPYISFLRDVKASYIVAKAMGQYWREAPITDEKVKTAAECWNKLGQATKDAGIQLTLHTDFLCALHSAEDIDKMMAATDPNLVGLTIDTAELTIAEVDPLKLYEKHYRRVKHFHFKDAHTTDSGAEYKEANADITLLVDGGKRGVERWFWEMGHPGGLVDFPGLMKAIKAHNFDGWIIVECDQSIIPAESAMLNGWYVKNVLAKAYRINSFRLRSFRRTQPPLKSNS